MEELRTFLRPAIDNIVEAAGEAIHLQQVRRTLEETLGLPAFTLDSHKELIASLVREANDAQGEEARREEPRSPVRAERGEGAQ